MLTYDAQAVAQALPYDLLTESLDRAFRADTEVPERTHHRVRVPGAADATLLLMPAWQSGATLGVKIATVFPDNARQNLPAVFASYLLLNARTGEPLAMLDGPELTLRRTAAVSALASRYLSRTDATTLLMVGTGSLAPQLIAAHAAVRDLTEVLVWGRRAEAAERVAAAFERADFTVAATSDLESAVQRADIVSCATLATEPLIEGRWLRAGQHVDLVGAFRPDMREADFEAISRADVYVDTFAGALSEAGEIVQSMEAKVLARQDIVGDLCALTRGTCRPRESADAITLFKAVGTALADLAAADLATGNSKHA